MNQMSASNRSIVRVHGRTVTVLVGGCNLPPNILDSVETTPARELEYRIWEGELIQSNREFVPNVPRTRQVTIK